MMGVNERFVSREEFNNRIADEAAQSCVDWNDPERRKEALRYIVKQIWNEAITEQSAPAAAPSLHKEEVNMLLRDPRDKRESGEHRADREQTSAFDARAWLAKEYPDWTADVKPYELELIERAYNSGRAARPAEKE